MLKKRGLGRGLDALIGAASLGRPEAVAGEELRQLPVEQLQRGRFQPRRDFNPEALEELAASIRVRGIIQPVVARRSGTDSYEIIAGERRWRAAQLAGLAEIPVVVREVPDDAAMAMALIENLQRSDLNAIEEAAALQRLQQEFQLTHEQIAEAVGRSRASVTNALRLLGLVVEVRDLLASRQLEMGHGRALLALPPEQQPAIARRIIADGLSVRATEDLIRKLNKPPPPGRRSKPAPDADILRLERELSDRLGANTAIEHGPKGRGRVVISYSSLDELDGILAHLRGNPAALDG